MNKTLANIISSLVPSKTGRRRWRGILRYGLINSIKLLIKLHREKTTPTRYFLTICAIAKNEGAYFQEWLEWHKNLGVEKFYIYDNESEDNTREILAPYVELGLVEYVFWRGKGQQMSVYSNCLDQHRLDAHWIAFIDLDEFIVPVKDKTIPDFLRRFEKFCAVEINWLIYGSSGAQKKEPGNVMDRFKRHATLDNIENRHVKSIVNPRRIFAFTGAHEAARISLRAADSHGTPITKNFQLREPQLDVIRINHYAVKSYEEFLSKRARGKTSRNRKNSLDYFDRFDLNDIYDIN